MFVLFAVSYIFWCICKCACQIIRAVNSSIEKNDYKITTQNKCLLTMIRQCHKITNYDKKEKLLDKMCSINSLIV